MMNNDRLESRNKEIHREYWEASRQKERIGNSGTLAYRKHWTKGYVIQTNARGMHRD